MKPAALPHTKPKLENTDPGQIADLGFARADLHRAKIKGYPEVIFGEGKSAEQILAIAKALLGRDPRLLITRLDAKTFAWLKPRLPGLHYHALAHCAFIAPSLPSLGLALKLSKPAGKRSAKEIAWVEPDFASSIQAAPARSSFTSSDILVLAAGTVDLPWAEEAALTAALMGCQVQRLYDVGVAGLHRLLSHVDSLRRASCLVVAAGMDGALASVVTGLTSKPVIGLPTPVGYGHGGQGEAALGTMLQACAPGLTVVNIGNGFGAGYAAAQIAKGHR